jgi:hypothetical protein
VEMATRHNSDRMTVRLPAQRERAAQLLRCINKNGIEPRLAGSDHSARQLFIVGGNHQVTDRGIEDNPIDQRTYDMSRPAEPKFDEFSKRS